MWYIGTMEYYSIIEKEQNYVIYRDADALTSEPPRKYDIYILPGIK